MEKILRKIQSKLLIGGDFNGYHHSSSSSKNCTTGKDLFDCVTELETNITLLNDGSQTYISDATGSKAALDLTFVDPRSVLLYIWKVGTDSRNRDHFPICIEYDGILKPRKGSNRASTLHNKDTDWTAFMEKVKEEITEVEMHNGWNRERERDRCKGKVRELYPDNQRKIGGDHLKKTKTTMEMEDKEK
jgi:hypothetical protein